MTDLRPGDPGWSDVREYVGGAQAAFEQFRRGAGLPALGDPAVWERSYRDPELGAHLAAINGEAPVKGTEAVCTEENPPLFELALPELGRLRLIGRLLALDAWVAAQAGQHPADDVILLNNFGPQSPPSRGFLEFNLSYH